jgi:hypothetical protein
MNRSIYKEASILATVDEVVFLLLQSVSITKRIDEKEKFILYTVWFLFPPFLRGKGPY